MTNEQIAALIGTGEADELLPMLWERTRKLYRKMSNVYASSHSERCLQCGVTAEDILSECYFVMLDAIKAYNKRPPGQADNKFTSYCGYHFKNRANSLLGIRTKKQINEPLNTAISLSTPVSNNSMGSPDETELGDLLPDTHSEEELHAYEDEEFRMQIREAVQEELADDPVALRVIEQRYYQERTLEAVGDDMSLSRERISQIQEAVLRRLKNNRKIQVLAGRLDPYRHISVDTFRREGSIVEQIVERRYESQRRSKVNRYAAYFSSLSDEALTKDLEMMRALPEASRNGMLEMIEALNEVTRRRGLGTVPLNDSGSGWW
ncbi:MAG: sigma-70 family RNA polymerase sigma factor [Ruminiclostridium sp.]|uniref:sigma-70 family RNA polymerase sigma factor n=1 Tax=Ruminococcus sp. TaxID=41978 RepID=UPI0025D96F39|nr:sigma-70 family RNA polymerase sigma factor [Ruminococcus sp.]MBR1433034.1 sigma-70 family RNA polymerase sigma factor [Ruminococcus sp.]MBR1831059.1 sigma-70 family RNA polymerase sigma factor [Ruminiclostridium sp.]